MLYILEGLVWYTPEGTKQIKPTSRDGIFTFGYNSTMRLSQVYAWLYQIGQFIQIYQTPSLEATCMALVAFYKGDQKAEHTTLQRYYKPLTFAPNPQVSQLIGLMPGIGEVRAKALITQFTTVWNVLNASPSELAKVDGMGPKLSKQLLQKVGRTDV